MRFLSRAASQLRHTAKAGLYACLPDVVLRRLVQRRFPRSAHLEVTTACNLDCPLCFTHVHLRADRFLRPAQLEEFLRGCEGRMRFANLHIQGEPLVHPQLFAIVRACAAHGVDTGFSTNGMLIGRHLEEILDSGLARISIAIDGCTAADYARYRKGGNFDLVVRNTRALLLARRERGSRRPFVQLQAVMFPYNEDRESELRSFLESFGADDVRLKRPSYCVSGEGIEARPAARRFLEDLGEGREARKYARPAGISPRLFRNRRLCPQLERASILSDGRVVACCMDSVGMTCFGNLHQQSFRSIWLGEDRAKIIEQFQQGRLALCRHCTLS